MLDLELKGKTALVTGGSRGIGRVVAKHLAAAGVDVALTYATNEDKAKSLVAEIEATGGRARAWRLDVSDLAATRQTVEEVTKANGGLHILVANAGIAIDGLIMRYKDDDLEKTFRTNVFGAFACARAALWPMMKARWGRIIFMGSVVGEMGNAGQCAYASSKAALDGLGRALAKELASRSITVNVVAPGFIETDMTDRIADEARKKLVEAIPLGSIGKPEDVADAVLFLASERARYITGQVLEVNGGLHM